jgi:pimeloyl-ACP methyl ester carboxylesterase
MKMILQFATTFLLLCFAVSAFAQNKPKEKFADFNGSRIFYTNHGKGKDAIVFVHGWTCNSEFWNGQVSAFPNYRVIAVDLIGHGKSDKPKANYSMEYFAKSIEAVLRKAKVRRAVLIGHSMGTPVIRQFYRLYPEKVLGLVIVDGALRPFAPREQMETYLAPMRKNYKSAQPEFVEGMLQPIKSEVLKNTIRASMLSTPDYVGLSAWDGMLDEKIWTNDQILAPTLAILAESPYWPANTKSFYSSLAPKMDFQMWKGVSHFLMMEKPKEFNEALLAFITKNELL